MRLDRCNERKGSELKTEVSDEEASETGEMQEL